mgnify:CR=1 FL=1
MSLKLTSSIENQLDTNLDGTVDRQEFVMRYNEVCEEVT